MDLFLFSCIVVAMFSTSTYVEGATIESSDEACSWKITQNAAIDGCNTKQIEGGVQDCTTACCNAEWCKSFDYYKSSGKCDLSKCTGESVGGLKTDWDDNPYDHYELGCIKVDCEWDEWVLGECSEECGGGIQIDTRQPLKEAQFGGNECEGESSRQKECNLEDCPEPCTWQFTENAAIDGCNTETMTGSVQDCKTACCNADWCKSFDYHKNENKCDLCNGIHTLKTDWENDPYDHYGVVAHCTWDEWTVGECDKTCGGGLLTKTRGRLQDAEHGGEECTGDEQITESCNVQECPVDCVWNDWVSGTCSKTCGQGVLVDTREKLQEEMFGGAACEGEPTRQTDCHIEDCPIVFHFNETCCAENGVTDHCMGLCRERIDERVEVILPIDQCDIFKDIIRSCLYSEGGETLEEATARLSLYPKSRSLFGSIMDWINY